MSRADNGLRGVLRQHLGHVGQWVTIETGGTEQGVPDSNLCVRPGGREVWIESKFTRGWAVRFKPAQIGWLFTRWRYGGNALVATWRINELRRGGLYSDELYLTSAEHVRKLSSDGLQAVPHLLECSGGPGQWPWVKIEHVLRHQR